MTVKSLDLRPSLGADMNYYNTLKLKQLIKLGDYV